MIRRAFIIGIVVAGVAVTTAETSPVYARLASSAQKFQQYFRELDREGTGLNPVERFVFSLVLANSKAPQTEGEGAAHGHRT